MGVVFRLLLADGDLFLQVKQDFLALLREQEEVVITGDTEWRKVKGSFSHDPRYKAVDSSSKREELFAEYVQLLKGTAPQVEAEVQVSISFSVVSIPPFPPSISPPCLPCLSLPPPP